MKQTDSQTDRQTETVIFNASSTGTFQTQRERARRRERQADRQRHTEKTGERSSVIAGKLRIIVIIVWLYGG